MNPLLPAPHIGLPQVSAYAAAYDWLFVALFVLSLFFFTPIVISIVYFAIKYRAGSAADRREEDRPTRQHVIEASWMLIPFLLTLVICIWAARLYVVWATPPAGALEIAVVGKQWMWQFQHPGGQREINTLHVPAGQPVKLLITSQDVVHSLFLPALRIKMDAIPGRYTHLWFTAKETGEFRLHCTEFCGTDHSLMGGQLIVMPPAEYQAWLSHVGTDMSLAAAGEGLFRQFGCSGCHGANATIHAPSLGGLFGTTVRTADGRDVLADEGYIRDCITLPDKNRVAGYPPLMPSFRGKIGEDDLLKLIAYIRSLPPGARP